MMKKQETSTITTTTTKTTTTTRFLVGNENNIHAKQIRVKNCLGCGVIMLESDFLRLGNCPQCERPLTSNKAKERRRRKLEGRLEGDDEIVLALESERDALVAIDKELAVRSR